MAKLALDMNELHRRTTHLTLVTAAMAAAIAGSATSAHALQGGEDPALLPVLVDKRYGQHGHHQVGVQFSTAIATKFIEGTGAYLTYGYNFSDLLGVEVGGAFVLGDESKIMTQVRANFPNQEPPLSDLYQMQWMGQANFMLVPFYGKMSFASWIDPAYDLFATVGAGAGGLRRQVGNDQIGVTYDSTVSLILNFGLGLRFYIKDFIALRLEMRNFFYPEPADGKGGFTHNLHFQGGVQFNFGGEE